MGNPQTGEQQYQQSSRTVVKVLSPTSDIPAWDPGKRLGGPRGSEEETLHSWGAQRKSCVCQDSGDAAVSPQETEPNLPVSVGESPAEVRVGSGFPREQGHRQQQSWEVTLGVSPLGDCR